MKQKYRAHLRASETGTRWVPTLNMAACGSPSSWNGGLPVAISMMVHPRDQMSAGAPYPRGPLSMISGAMYCRVPARGEADRTISGVSNILMGSVEVAQPPTPTPADQFRADNEPTLYFCKTYISGVTCHLLYSSSFFYTFFIPHTHDHVRFCHIRTRRRVT